MDCRQNLSEVLNHRCRGHFHHRLGPTNGIDQLCDVGHCQTDWRHRYWYVEHDRALVHLRDLAAGDSRCVAGSRGVEYCHGNCCGVLDHIRHTLYGRRVGLATSLSASIDSWSCSWIRDSVPSILVSLLNRGLSAIPKERSELRVRTYRPRWLVSKGRDAEALQALAKLRRLPTIDTRIQQEWFDIRAEVAFHKETSALRHPGHQDRAISSRIKLELLSWTDCFKRGCWRRTHVGVGLMFFQQLVGINALIYYSPTLFKTMGLDYSLQLIMSGVLNVTQLVGVITSIWTMDRFGRRPLLLWGSLFMTLSHLIIAILVGKFSSDWPSHRAAGWVSVAFLLFYMLSFGASWGPVRIHYYLFVSRSKSQETCSFAFPDLYNRSASYTGSVGYSVRDISLLL